MEIPITQATGRGDRIVNVFADRVEIRSGWQSQNVEEISHKEISSASVRGLINCALILQTNAGRVYQIERLALREANQIKSAIERQKEKAGLYE